MFFVHFDSILFFYWHRVADATAATAATVIVVVVISAVTFIVSSCRSVFYFLFMRAILSYSSQICIYSILIMLIYRVAHVKCRASESQFSCAFFAVDFECVH